MTALLGVRVLDLTRYIPGPYCTMLLADLGAEVVKVEDPGTGDPVRWLPPPVGEDSAAHAALNRNKRSVAIDWRKEEGGALVRRLAMESDVLVETFRPGTLDRRGLGAAALTKGNPRLVYCSLTGYGPDGPLASRAGHDIDYVAHSGLLSLLRDARGEPIVPGAQLADMAAGLAATIGVLAALQARERTGRGQVVDVSLLHSALALASVPLARALPGASAADELGGSHACYTVYRCRDGRHLAVGALEPKFWEGLVRALGLPQLAGRQWLDGDERRAMRETVAGVFATRGRDDWMIALGEADVCVAPVLDLAEAKGQPQAAHAMRAQPVRGGQLTAVAAPFALSGTPLADARLPPALGADTSDVLRRAGLDEAAITRLRESGVVA